MRRPEVCARVGSAAVVGAKTALFGLLLITGLACNRNGAPQVGDAVAAGTADSLSPEASAPAGSDSALPAYVGVPPANAARLHELAPDRFTSDPPTQSVALEVVYDQGFGGGLATVVHVSGEYVYWEQLGSLMQGRKDASVAPKEVGTWGLRVGRPIRSDATHVYWLDRESLKRYPHAGGQEEVIKLPWDHREGDFQVDDKYVYVAMPGCPALTRIDKQTLIQNTIYGSAPSPAPVTVLLTEAGVYCASGPALKRVRNWESDMVTHVEVEGRIFAALVQDQYIYWFAEPPGAFAGTPYMWRAPLSSDAEPAIAEQLHRAVGWIYDFVSGAPGTWALATGQAPTINLLAYLPARDEARLLAAKVGLGGGLSADDKHYYFSQQAKCCVDSELSSACVGTCCDTCSAIVRLPIDTPTVPLP